MYVRRVTSGSDWQEYLIGLHGIYLAVDSH